MEGLYLMEGMQGCGRLNPSKNRPIVTWHCKAQARTGLFEVLDVTPALRDTIQRGSAPRELEDGAVLTEMKKLVVLGPGDIAQAHTQDEWILLDQLEKGTQLYAKLIRHWCA